MMEMKKKENGGVKITVSQEAEKALVEMVDKVNEGFSGGRVSKQDLASWIVRYFEREGFIRCKEMIRSDHFDQVAHLEAVLRQAKEARRQGAADTDVAAILSAVPLGRQPQMKKLKKGERSGDVITTDGAHARRSAD